MKITDKRTSKPEKLLWRDVREGEVFVCFGHLDVDSKTPLLMCEDNQAVDFNGLAVEEAEGLVVEKLDCELIIKGQ